MKPENNYSFSLQRKTMHKVPGFLFPFFIFGISANSTNKDLLKRLDQKIVNFLTCTLKSIRDNTINRSNK
jgi:hypothetical protein